MRDIDYPSILAGQVLAQPPLQQSQYDVAPRSLLQKQTVIQQLCAMSLQCMTAWTIRRSAHHVGSFLSLITVAIGESMPGSICIAITLPSHGKNV